VIRYEPEGLAPDVVAELEAMGHRLEVRAEPSGDVQAVRVGSDGVEGVADPRRGGVALAP
jgi:gamma-glutamyltranspeptidase